MNYWTELSVQFANQRNYLDELFQVYPTIPEGIREIESPVLNKIEEAFQAKDNHELLQLLLKMDLFPIKDSYIAYFKRWLRKKALGVEPLKLDEFLKAKGNVVLDASQAEMISFARERLDYKHNKGLNFIARFNGKYVIGEAKFLTDFEGHQHAQYLDEKNTMGIKNTKAEKVIILDGYLRSRAYNKMYKKFSETYKDYTVISIFVFREYLYQI